MSAKKSFIFLWIGLVVFCSACAQKYPASLMIIKQVEPRTVGPGDTVQVTIDIANTGRGVALSLVTKEEIPEGFSYKAGTLQWFDERRGNVNPGSLWHIGNISPGSKSNQVTISYEALVSEEVEAGQKQFITHIQGTSEDDSTIKKTEAVSVEVKILKPKLVIEKQMLSERAMPGDTIACTITVFNRGNASSWNTVITDELPTELSYLAGSLKTTVRSLGLSEPEGLPPYTWNIGELKAEQEARLSYDVLLDEGLSTTSFLSTKASVSGMNKRGKKIQTESRPTMLDVVLPPKLSVEKSFSSQQVETGGIVKVEPGGIVKVEPGGLVTCTIRIENTGGGDALSVTAIDSIPSYFTYQKNARYGPAGKKIEPIKQEGSYVWEIGLLESGKSIEISYNVQVQPGDVAEKIGVVVKAKTKTDKEVFAKSEPKPIEVARPPGPMSYKESEIKNPSRGAFISTP